MGTLARQVPRVTRVHRVTLDPLAFPDLEESRETLVNVELREIREKRERLGWRDRRETWD